MFNRQSMYNSIIFIIPSASRTLHIAAAEEEEEKKNYNIPERAYHVEKVTLFDWNVHIAVLLISSCLLLVPFTNSPSYIHFYTFNVSPRGRKIKKGRKKENCNIVICQSQSYLSYHHHRTLLLRVLFSFSILLLDTKTASHSHHHFIS